MAYGPPVLQVKLIELANEDQLAVRIGDGETGKGELDVGIQSKPVFDVVVTQATAPLSAVRA